MLRPYQQDAVDSAIRLLDSGSHPVLQLATGTGKSLISAAIASHFLKCNRRTWIITHIQQLVEQNASAYTAYCGDVPGVVCAGLNRKDTAAQVTVATIQSLIGIQAEMPSPHVIIVDEAHRVPHNKGDKSLYEHVLSRHRDAKRVAMTATPWRMDNGIIHGEGDQFWFDRLAYSYPVGRAVADGYLCPLVGVETAVQLDLGGVLKAAGEFVMSDIDNREDAVWLRAVARSLPSLAGSRKHLAVYCPTIEAAGRAAAVISAETGWNASTLAGSITRLERSSAIKRFKSGEIRVLCSVDMITTGFDFPALDCIVCLRPTQSSSLWVQMQGRGTRLSDGKKNCLVLDFVGNLQRLGGVDMYEKFFKEDTLEEVEASPAKSRKERGDVVGVHRLAPIDPMTGKEAETGAMLRVRVKSTHSIPVRTKRNPHAPVMMVSYSCISDDGAKIVAANFINTENPDRKTLEFFNARRLAVRMPSPAAGIVWQMKGAHVPEEVLVRRSGKYWNIIEEYFNTGED